MRSKLNPKLARPNPRARQRGRPVDKPRFNPNRHKRRHDATLSLVGIGLTIGVFVGIGIILHDDPQLLDRRPSIPVVKAFLDDRQAKRDALVPPGGFRSCGQAKAVGFKEIYAGEKGYKPQLDRDLDGRACEWNGWRLF